MHNPSLFYYKCSTIIHHSARLWCLLTKSQCFTLGWEDTWIETARTIVQDEFDQTYAFMDVEREAESPEDSNKV